MAKKLISFFILCMFIGLIWSYAGRNQPASIPQLHLSEIQEINSGDSLKRTLVGIQPYMEVSDYFYQSTFQEKLRLYLKEAKAKGFLNKNAVVLFPEYLGTWLVVEGEKQTIAEKKTLQAAMSTMVLSNLFEFGLFYFQSGNVQDKPASALFRMKSIKMAKSYFSTFSELAEEFNTYLVAGSIILPNPLVVDGEIFVDTKGDLVNASFIFGPDGKIIGDPILKAFPIESEKPFLSAKPSSDIPVFDLPLGKTSVLICADSWYSESYQNAKNQDAEIILVPSYCSGEETMAKLWQGYSGYEEPQGTDLADIGKITEQAAWEKYALPGQIGKSGAAYGMNVFLRGDLWDLGTDGQPFVISEGKLLDIKPAEKAGIWALNF